MLNIGVLSMAQIVHKATPDLQNDPHALSHEPSGLKKAQSLFGNGDMELKLEYDSSRVLFLSNSYQTWLRLITPIQEILFSSTIHFSLCFNLIYK